MQTRTTTSSIVAATGTALCARAPSIYCSPSHEVDAVSDGAVRCAPRNDRAASQDCDVPCRGGRNVFSNQFSEGQCEEVQISAGNRWESQRLS